MRVPSTRKPRAVVELTLVQQYWKRRWFELRSADLRLYKSQQVRDDLISHECWAITSSNQDTAKALEEIALVNRVRAITDDPEEAAIANSFKLSFKGEDDDCDFLFYTDEKVRSICFMCTPVTDWGFPRSRIRTSLSQPFASQHSCSFHVPHRLPPLSIPYTLS